MEFEIEESFKIKIDLIIERDLKELFGDDGEGSSSEERDGIISAKKSEIRTALPFGIHEILVSMEALPVDNPYNRLLTAIEIAEDNYEDKK